jgi:CubicO group peptidase (beta-lactamase class C family)
MSRDQARRRRASDDLERNTRADGGHGRHGGSGGATVTLDLNELTREIAEELNIAGAQVAVLQGDQISEGVAGVENRDTGLPVVPETLFQIGSTTKMFTAALVMEQVAEGKIELDVPVVEQLPGFKLSDKHALATVTPRHLMSMSSGMDNGPYTDHGRGDDALARYVAALADEPHVFPPGDGYGYSNASTCVSGRLVEHVTGNTWDEEIRTRIFEPAGLRNSATLTEDIIHRRFGIGHKQTDDGGLEVIHSWSLPRSTSPTGGTLCTTATDLVRFAHLFLNGGRSLEGAQVLTGRTVDGMQIRQTEVPYTLMADWWGLGPYGRLWDGVALWGHSGTNLGGSSYLLWAPERQIAVASTVNTARGGYPLARRVQEAVFGELGGIKVPPKPEPPEHVEIDADRLVGTYSMHGLDLFIAARDGGLTVSAKSDLPGIDPVIEEAPLLALTPTSFLPTDSRIDGSRGYAIAFVGAEEGPARHLVNGVFAMRRTA